MKNKRKRLFIQSVFPAPYRVGVFRGLSKEYDIFVAFERNNDENRNSAWFDNNFDFPVIVLDNKEADVRYKQEFKNLKIYDVVLVYDYASVSSIKLMLRCIWLNIPYFINCDGAFIKRHPIKDLIKRFFITRARACLSSGVYAERYFLTYGAKKENIYRHNFTSLNKVDILNEPISCDEKNRIREKLGLPVDKKIVLSIGRFAYGKGYDVLLKAWKLINEDSKLVIVGGGEKELEYKQFIDENNLENVTIEGFKHKDIIFDYYKAADLFVLPTREDVWGLVINEAMACGLPVITTDRCVAGLELIENNINGFIIPAEDNEILAEKIKIILRDGKVCESMRQENLNKIHYYNIENITKSHINTLELIIGVNK